MPQTPHPWWRYALLLGLFAGCSKEKMDAMVNTVKDQANAIASNPTIAKVLPATGNVQLAMTPPVSTTAAYVKIHKIGDGRPNVVHFTSYEPTGGPNQFPAILVRGITTANEVAELAGKNVAASVYVQTKSGASVYRTRPGDVIEMSISPPVADKNTVAATLPGFTLYDPQGQPMVVSQMTWEAVP